MGEGDGEGGFRSAWTRRHLRFSTGFGLTGHDSLLSGFNPFTAPIRHQINCPMGAVKQGLNTNPVCVCQTNRV